MIPILSSDTKLRPWAVHVVWAHETDSRTWPAPSLDTDLEWSLDGRITL